MPDDPKKKNPHDAQRINMSEGYEVRYWTKKFHVSEQKLKSTVSRVGPMAKDVQRELDK